jgi:ParB-like chromosome segregation protein Spo0J
MHTIRFNGKDYTVLYPKLLPQLSPEERAGLEDDIGKHGVVVPVVVDEDNGIIDGINRLEIAAKLGLDDVPLDMRKGLTAEEKKDLAVSLNEHRRHLTPEDRR